MLLRSVTPPHWRSPSQRSRSLAFRRWRSIVLFNLPMYFRLFFRLKTWNPSCFTPGSSLPRLMLWWRTRCAPSTSGTHWRFFSALGRFLGRWYFTYQRSSPGAVDRANDVPALFGKVILKIPVWFTSKFQASLSSNFCSGRAVLALVRPVVPYTLALSAAFAVGGVCVNGTLQRSRGRPIFSPDPLL